MRSVAACLAAGVLGLASALAYPSARLGPCAVQSTRAAPPTAPSGEPLMVSVQRDQAVAAAIRALGATRLTMTLPKLMRWPEFEASDCVGHLYFPPDVVWFVAVKGGLAAFTR